MSKLKTVILCGGNGSRLFPISRKSSPKQFLKFNGESLFEKTISRNRSLSSDFLIIGNESQKFLAQTQSKNISHTELWESVGRNSSAPIIMAALMSDPEDILLITPSDQLIENQKAYEVTIQSAINLAVNDNIVAIGIDPTYPATGFGYIKTEDKLNISSFIEKPEKKIAQELLNSKKALWNGGIYCFKSSHFLSECETHCKNLLDEAKIALKQKNSYSEIPKEAMMNIPDISIDYALMMNLTENFKVVPLNAGWDDMGSFDSIHKMIDESDEQENVISLNSSNNLVIANSDRLVSLFDVQDLIVVDTPDAILITKKGSSQGVKHIVEEIKTRKPKLLDESLTTHRPWGSYTIIENTDVYKTKKLTVSPNKRLSLQSHFHRNEHWIIVSGVALVTIGDEVKQINPNESVYIPAGTKHRLENPGKIPLVVIEAQIGEYLEEDDIIRYEDDFKRS